MAREHGILVPRAGEQRFTLTRRPPSDDLASIVDRFWAVRWDLRGKPPFEQETLPYPCVNLVIGTHRPGVHGPLTSRFVARLEGEGWVLGAKFQPAGFRGLTRVLPFELADRVLTLHEAFGDEGRALDAAVLASDDDLTRIALVEGFLRAHHPGMEDEGRETNRIVEFARVDPSIARVAHLATWAGRPVRAIERLFRNHVGVSPKWVIRRFRVQEAAVRLAAGGALDSTALAQELGYFDQAHFIRDFKAQVGRTPAQYAKMCSAR
jgi:AraC-like DNA-binding protein